MQSQLNNLASLINGLLAQKDKGNNSDTISTGTEEDLEGLGGLEDLENLEGLGNFRISEGGKNGGVRMAMIGLQELDQKIKIMRERRRLRERKLRIDDDLTLKEKKMRWNLEDSKKGERKESMGKLRKDTNRRKMVEMRRRRDTQR
ncbi:hypothetical protein EAG_03053 [Camponotus floridanus]|uniref:Uncharacterized protein n=1 Tax=Camponotus floridanus TaxID=104421 RepID=E2AXG7_CAMFO|nr:hypothetical protein EAG_03053 [Camponotus floridanus]